MWREKIFWAPTTQFDGGERVSSFVQENIRPNCLANDASEQKIEPIVSDMEIDTLMPVESEKKSKPINPKY
jgi:hypothetical protein